MPTSNVVPYGDEDEVREPPLYTMEYRGIVKYHKDGEIITVICMNQMKTLKMLVKYKINGWTDTFWETNMGELFEIVELPKVYKNFSCFSFLFTRGWNKFRSAQFLLRPEKKL